jgi:hypothetical protein
MIPYHDHNADRVRPGLIARMGTRRSRWSPTPARRSSPIRATSWCATRAPPGHTIVTLPGPCAAIAALTLAGLPTDRFLFLGFLPSKAKARADAIAEVAGIRATLVFYESGPRLAATLAALAEGLGDREAAVAREISKRFEECVTGTLSHLAARYADAPPKGEIVVVVGPPGEAAPVTSTRDRSTPDALLREALTRLCRAPPRPRAKSPRQPGCRPQGATSMPEPVGARDEGMRDRRQAERIGRIGETGAAWWLRLKGWRILGAARAHAGGRGRPVARKKGLVAFVEVKPARRGPNSISRSTSAGSRASPRPPNISCRAMPGRATTSASTSS